MRLGLVALVLVGLLGLAPGAPAIADGPTGTLRVTLTDAPGVPVPGMVILLPVGGTWAAAPRAVGVVTRDFDVPPGRYGVVGITAWGGIRCAGVEPCGTWTLPADQFTVPGVVDVEAGELSTYTLTAPPPATVTGTGTSTGTLTVTLSEPMEQLAQYLTSMAEFGHPQVQWLRDGEDIAGATGDTYTPGVQDRGHTIAARLGYHPYAGIYLSRELGADPAPVTVPGPAVDRIASTAVARLRPASVPRGGRSSLLARVADATGRVRVRVAGWTGSCRLAGGRCEVRLPRLRPGRYDVTASYLGSHEFLPSAAPPCRLTVTR